MAKLSLIKCLVLCAILLNITACTEKESGVAAPLNDLSVLEKLADSYREISNQYPTNPANLSPKVRLQFVEEVFRNAGYGYKETLFDLANIDSKNITKLHRDMQELLFLPHHRLGKEALKDIYNDEEIFTIEKIKIVFK